MGTFGPGSRVSHNLKAAAMLIKLIESAAPQQPFFGEGRRCRLQRAVALPQPNLPPLALRFAFGLVLVAAGGSAAEGVHDVPASAFPGVFGGAGAGPGGNKGSSSLLLNPVPS